MKKSLLAFCSLFLAATCMSNIQAQNTQNYQIGCIAFYNLENLFDTLDSPNTNDFDFTPDGELRYNTRVYTEKIANLTSVVAQLGADAPDGATIVGVTEVENRSVLEDFVKHPNIAKRNYQIAHHDSPDRRGIDVAVLYNPKYFEVMNTQAHTVSGALAPGDTLYTRDIYVVSGIYMGEPLHILIGHWPSRRGGEKASEHLRKRAAKVCREAADSIFALDPKAKIVVMGDLNDDPVNVSVAEVLGAKGTEKEVQPQGLFNPFWKWYKKGIGSLGYNDAWNLFDQIIISHEFLNKDQDGFYFYKSEVFNKRFLMAKTGRFKGYPWRTYSNGEYIGGYSDHFPTQIYIRRKVK